MNRNILLAVQKILKKLPDIHNTQVALGDSILLAVNEDSIKTPLGEAFDLFSYRSPLRDDDVNIELGINILDKIVKSQSYKRLNHIGLCYKVDSSEKEIARISEIIRKAGISLYQEPSNDVSPWLFIGDLTEIDAPVLEILPNEGNTGDEWEDYWLPHIQIDIDTELNPDEIEDLVKQYIDNPMIPYTVKIDGVCYIQRVQLGTLGGINLFLDISTNNRDIHYRETWTKLIN